MVEKLKGKRRSVCPPHKMNRILFFDFDSDKLTRRAKMERVDDAHGREGGQAAGNAGKGFKGRRHRRGSADTEGVGGKGGWVTFEYDEGRSREGPDWE